MTKSTSGASLENWVQSPAPIWRWKKRTDYTKLSLDLHVHAGACGPHCHCRHSIQAQQLMIMIIVILIPLKRKVNLGRNEQQRRTNSSIQPTNTGLFASPMWPWSSLWRVHWTLPEDAEILCSIPEDQNPEFPRPDLTVRQQALEPRQWGHTVLEHLWKALKPFAFLRSHRPSHPRASSFLRSCGEYEVKLCENENTARD